MAILAPENSEINVSGGPSRGWDKLVIRFLPVILSSAKFFAVIYRWRLTGGPRSRRPAASLVRSVDVTNDAEIIAILRESFAVPCVSHVVVAAPNGLSFPFSVFKS